MNAVIELIDELYRELSPPALLLLALWLLSMIAVPVLRWTVAAGAERLGVTAGVYAQAALVTALLWGQLGGLRAAGVALAIVAAGWLVELLGSRSGFPFGAYEYTDVLKPQIGRVPLLIPLAWLMMLPPAWAVAASVLGANASPALFIVVAAAAFTAWDLYLDPLMVSWNFWSWKRRGRYFGIPLVNFFGWFLAAAAISAVALSIAPPLLSIANPALLLVYAVTALLQAAGQLLFWRLPGPALCGLAGMGGFTLLAVL